MNQQLPDHRFNDDLLANADDLGFVQTQWPSIAFALYHPKLIETFAVYDSAAKKEMRKLYRGGQTAIIFSSIALLAAYAEASLGTTAHHLVAVTIVRSAEILGIVGTLIAVLGIAVGPWKRGWLANRFMTERLRQWHFQRLVRRSSEIVRIATSHDRALLEGFSGERDRELMGFLRSIGDRKGAALTGLIVQQERGPIDVWLHTKNESERPSESKAYEELLRA